MTRTNLTVMTAPIRTIRPAALLLAAAMAGACVAPADNRTGVGDWQPEALTATEQTAYAKIDPNKPDQPSLTGVDRNNWSERTMVIGDEPVLTYPTYRSNPSYTSATARQRGEYPTALSALETTNDQSLSQQTAEGFAFPFWGALDIPAMIPRVFITPPGKLVQSPVSAAPRAPQATAPVAQPTDATPNAPVPATTPPSQP